MFITEPIVGHGVRLPDAGLSRGRAGALPPLRDALLRRRGGDRLRPHGTDVRVRALGARAGRDARSSKALSGGYVPIGAHAVRAARVRRRLRLDGARAQPRLDVRAQRPRRRRRAGDAPRARGRGPGRALGAHRRAAARADAAARRALRRGARRPRPGAVLGDRVRRARAARRRWRMLERLQAGIFSQLVVVPLFSDHRVLIQVAGHNMNVVRACRRSSSPRRTWTGSPTRSTRWSPRAQKMPTAMTRFALKAARAGRPRVRAAR